MEKFLRTAVMYTYKITHKHELIYSSFNAKIYNIYS